MLKPRGAICNLGCQYCYYLRKEDLYPGAQFRMSDEVLEEYTRQYIESQASSEIVFAWQGGEPTLMGLDFFRRAVALQNEYRKPGLKISNTMQTNGVALDDEWCRFLREHGFLVGLSLDGPGELHDSFRVDKGGNPTHDRVMAGQLLLKRHRVEFNILACVHAANAEYPLEVYRFLRDEVGTQYMQFIPIVERYTEGGLGESTQVTERSITGQQYGDFLNVIFDEWVRRDVGRIFVQIFDVALSAWTCGRPGLCIFEETCGTALAMEHNGDLYSCDHFVEPHHRLGNIQRTGLAIMVGSRRQYHFGQAKKDSLPQHCRDCGVQFICNGGCPKNRFTTTPSNEPGLNHLCEGYKAFFTHIDRPMKIMASLLGAKRPPADIVRILAEEDAELQRQFAQAGRNVSCPCGSGRKFKHCHGRKGYHSVHRVAPFTHMEVH
jgi:uncharacterized protein